MPAKRTENPNFGSHLRATCLALESAERQHRKSLDLSSFPLGRPQRRQGSWAVSVARSENGGILQVKCFWAVFRRNSGLALPKFFR